MADEIKTEQIKVGGFPLGGLVKVIERLGVSTIMLAAVCFAGYQYFKYQEGENLRRQIVMIKKLNRIEQVARAEKGCMLNLNEQNEEDKIFEIKK